MASPRRLLCVSLIAVVALVAGCSGGSSSNAPKASTSGNASSAAGGSAVFQLVKADGSTVPFSLAALRRLPLVSIMSDGQPQEGPSLISVLQSGGVTSFSTVIVTGASSSKTLSSAQVTKNVILDFNNRGSVKLVAPSWAKPQRVIDVTKIEVRG